MRKTMNRIRATSVFTLEVANTILKQTLFGYKVVGANDKTEVVK